MIDTRLGEARLAGFLPDVTLPGASLAELSGDRGLAEPGSPASGLQTRVARAWATPLPALTCAQARVLVGQRFGLPWLARPVAAFVARWPSAECDLYPGDLAVVALRSWRGLHAHAAPEAEAMLRADFAFLEGDGGLAAQALRDLAEARVALRIG